jgi:predicted ribosomally synthesized peptide with SipW-like signal peptide
MINKRIALRSVSIVASLALIAGATFAFFSDSETSENNVFRAGGLDLKVDYTCYYNVDRELNPSAAPNCPWDNVQTDLAPSPLLASWEETDLGLEHKFFGFRDVKPGDFGEGTISLHVVDNDAWMNLRITDVQDRDNTCTESELVAEPTCENDLAPGDGELREQLLFEMWLDQGATPGFQCGEVAGTTCSTDPTEGDNIWQQGPEPPLITEGTIDDTGELHVAAPAFAVIHDTFTCTDTNDDTPEDGAADGLCPGLTNDGHFVGSITYYLGVAWRLPEETGDEVQTDSLLADIAFEVEQYRHNPSPVPSPI